MELNERIRNSRFIRIINFLQRWRLIICSVLAVLIIAGAAGCRYLLGIDLFGWEEVIVVIAFWLYFIGGVNASSEDSHISADLVSEFVHNGVVKSFLIFISKTIQAAVAIILSYWAFGYLRWAIDKWATTSALEIPLVVSQSPIFIGFLFMAMYSVILCIESWIIFRNAVKKKKEMNEVV